jgi:hypothetical protein
VSQHSTLTSSSFQATGFTFPGFFYLAGSSYIKYNIAAQTCSATFALTTPMNFHDELQPSAGSPPGEGSSWVALHLALSNGPTTYKRQTRPARSRRAIGR